MKNKSYKFEVCAIGPGSYGGAKFSSLTEALRYAGYMLKQGRECKILHIITTK